MIFPDTPSPSLDEKPLILLVEDDRAITRFLIHTLSPRYRLTAAQDGEEGLARARALAPDVIVSDVMMPRMDGEQFVRQLRREDALRATPLVILTAQTDDQLRVRLLREGVQDYLVKPFSVEELSVRLDNIIRRRRAEEAVRRLSDDLEERVLDRTCALEAANRDLQREVAERREVENRLKASIGEKETLLREIHHRVKNNLQIVYSLLNLQTRDVKDPKTLEGLQDCRHRVLAMALVHEKLYHAKDLACIPAAEYFRDLTRNLFYSYGAAARAIGLALDVDPVALDMDEAVPCGLVVYELVSNSLKHAFPDGRSGTIRVALKREPGGRTRLLVQDDGAGFPPDIDFRQSCSLGLRLVCALAKQMDGDIRLERGRGTSFQLLFNSAKTAVQQKEAVS